MLPMQIIDTFFNFDTPCPDSIQNCEGLRKKFTDDVDNARKQPGCSACRIRGIRNHYISIITNGYGSK